VSTADICFLVTAKSGLGHLRRSLTIATRLRAIAPALKLHLISNAPPDGMSGDDLRSFDSIQVLDRDQMAQAAVGTRASVLVLDTLTVPGIERTGLQLVLVLRETPDDKLTRFRLADGKPWDLVLIVNPAEHWMPGLQTLAARCIIATGWIYRRSRHLSAPRRSVPRVLVATGGGGTVETAHRLYETIDAVLATARGNAAPFEVVQAIGPRARAFGQLAHADRATDPGGALNELFCDADVVISTVGYNSVLELAMTDTPSLLVPIPRSIDDQEARARSWAGALGAWLDATHPEEASAWLRRRLPVDLGPSGEDKAARAILNLA
jgi:predicted glycosyltransferase